MSAPSSPSSPASSSPADALARWRTVLHDQRAWGVRRAPPSLDAHQAVAIATNAGWSSWLVDGHCSTRDELMDAFATGCAFPEWFGRNYDALSDCLSDLDLPAGRGAIVWATAGELAAKQPDAWPTMRSILDDAVRFRREHDERLFVVCVGRSLPGLAKL